MNDATNPETTMNAEAMKMFAEMQTASKVRHALATARVVAEEAAIAIRKLERDGADAAFGTSIMANAASELSQTLAALAVLRDVAKIAAAE